MHEFIINGIDMEVQLSELAAHPRLRSALDLTGCEGYDEACDIRR